uniref:Tantalus-like domain-containing protein n=1 Tax=Clastoptera arizonana TaxID=38151 RepID=A0A1B6D133_9HEMI
MFSITPKDGFVVQEKNLRRRNVKYLTKKVMQNTKEPLYNIDESSSDSTMTQSSSNSSSCSFDIVISKPNTSPQNFRIKKKRSKSKRSFTPVKVLPKIDETLSDYELLRERNIKENLKQLRLIFEEQGLQMPQSTEKLEPKIRRKYVNSPLPPPRPKSMRLRKNEVRIELSASPHKRNKLKRHTCLGISLKL